MRIPQTFFPISNIETSSLEPSEVFQDMALLANSFFFFRALHQIFQKSAIKNNSKQMPGNELKAFLINLIRKGYNLLMQPFSHTAFS